MALEEALAAGIASVPTGDANRSSDAFFLFEELMGRYIFISGVGMDTVGEQATVRFDSKAMRRVEDGFDVAMTIEAQAIVSSGQVKKSGRMLIKLH